VADPRNKDFTTPLCDVPVFAPPLRLVFWRSFPWSFLMTFSVMLVNSRSTYINLRAGRMYGAAAIAAEFAWNKNIRGTNAKHYFCVTIIPHQTQKSSDFVSALPH